MWIIKILGLVMIFISCVLIGASKVNMYFERYKSLKLIVEILSKAKSDIALKNDTLANSIKLNLNFLDSVNDTQGYEFLKYIANEKLLTKTLSKNEIDLFNNSILNTYATTRDEEVLRLNRYINEFQILSKEAKKELDEKKKLYFGLGIYSGLALVIMLV